MSDVSEPAGKSMRLGSIGLVVGGVLALVVIHFVVFAFVAAMLFPQTGAEPTVAQQATDAAAQATSTEPRAASDATEATRAVLALLVVALLNTVVLSYIILRARWAGLRLVVTVFALSFGAMTVMNQIESAFFLTNLPPGTVIRLFLLGAIVAAVNSPLAVVILGKARTPTIRPPTRRLAMPAGEWVWKLAVIVVAYVTLYFTLGYFVAWRNPAVLAFYGGSNPGSFLGQLRFVFSESPWLPGLQAIRALMWAALALPLIRMMKGSWWEAGLATALLFSVLANAQLLLPNPYMPEAVRMVHLVETALANFIFAWFAVWLLVRHQPAPEEVRRGRRERGRRAGGRGWRDALTPEAD